MIGEENHEVQLTCLATQGVPTFIQLGFGRKNNDNLSLFARVGHEAATGGVASRLSPTDGMQGIGVGGSVDFAF